MMYRSVSATISPLIDAARTCTAGTCHTANARMIAVPNDSGMARLAGQRRITRNTATVMIGSRESTERVATLIVSVRSPSTVPAGIGIRRRRRCGP